MRIIKKESGFSLIALIIIIILVVGAVVTGIVYYNNSKKIKLPRRKKKQRLSLKNAKILRTTFAAYSPAFPIIVGVMMELMAIRF